MDLSNSADRRANEKAHKHIHREGRSTSTVAVWILLFQSCQLGVFTMNNAISAPSNITFRRQARVGVGGAMQLGHHR